MWGGGDRRTICCGNLCSKIEQKERGKAVKRSRLVVKRENTSKPKEREGERALANLKRGREGEEVGEMHIVQCVSTKTL